MKKLTKLLLALTLLIVPVVSLSGIQKAQAAGVLDDIGYPFAPGQTWYVYQGYNTAHTHNGTMAYAFDLTKGGMDVNNTGGAELIAAASGTFYKYNLKDSGYPENYAWGAEIQLGGGYIIKYFHLDANSLSGIANGTRINKGDYMGRVASSYPGGVNHLHFDVRYNGWSIPLTFGVWNFPAGGSGDNGEWSGTAITNPLVVPDEFAKHVTSQVFKGKLYQSYVDQENRVRTRYTSNGSKWTELPTDGHTPGNVTMAVFTPKKGAKPRLYQSVRGLSGFLFMRYTEDGKTWKTETGREGWDKHEIEIKNDVDTIVVKDSKGVEYMYQSVVTKDDKLAIRFKQTGMVNNWNTWKVYESARVKIDTDLTPEVSNGTTVGLFITAIKKDGNNIISQRFNLAAQPVDNMPSWTSAGRTDMEIGSTLYKSKAYQFVKGQGNNKTYSRKSPLATSWREEGGGTTYGVALTTFRPNKKEEMLVEAVKGGTKLAFIRMTSADDFSTTDTGWQQVFPDEPYGRPDIVSYKPSSGKNLLMHTLLIKDKSNHIVPMSRYTTDGTTWSSWNTPRVNEDWELQEGQTLSNITSVTFKNKLYQAVRGTVGDSIYMRSSADGIFDSEKWVKQEGTTSSDINMVVYNNELYQVIGGSSNSGRVFVRSTKDGVFDGEADEKWLEMTGMLANANIDFEVFGGKLYFTLVKKGTTDIYMAKQNGHINASMELNWEKQVGNTDGDVNMEVYNSKLYQIVRGTNNSGRIYIRESKDGIYNSDSEKWKELTGLDKITHVSIQNFNKGLNIVARRTDDTIYSTKITNLKVTALTWKLETGRTSKHVEMGVFDGKLFQTVRSTGDTTNIFMRSSKDGVFDLNW